MAYTVPLIASGFDALNNQRLGWAGLSSNNENANVARAIAAQNEANRWKFDVARMNREAAAQDAQLQEQAKREAINSILRNQQAAEDRRRFDIGTALDRQKLAADERRYMFPIEEKARTEREGKQAVSNFAETMKDEVNDAGRRHDEALKAYNDAQTALTLASAEQEKNLIPGTWAKRGGEFIPNQKYISTLGDAAKQKEATDAIASANAELARLASEADAAATRYDIHSRSFDDLKANAARNYGLEILKRGSRYVIFNPENNRMFSPNIVGQPAVASLPASATQPESAPTNPLPSWVFSNPTATAGPLPGWNPPVAETANSRTATAQYIPNRVYNDKGVRRRYLGGDPYDARNWVIVE